MLAPDLLETLTKSAGGRFRLTTLLQKRARELCLGAPALVPSQADRPHEVAADEALHGAIYLVAHEPGAAEAEGEN